MLIHKIFNTTNERMTYVITPLLNYPSRQENAKSDMETL